MGPNELQDKMEEAGVASHLRAGLARYLVDHVKPGGFLSAVLKNDLATAVMHADEFSLANIREVVAFLKTMAPPDSWGSQEKVAKWTKE